VIVSNGTLLWVSNGHLTDTQQPSESVKFYHEDPTKTRQLGQLCVEGRGDGVYVNDRLLSEPYVKDGNTGRRFTVRTLKADEYWVMGDNRASVDQDRFLRLITATQVIGTVTDIENT
jgi:hypothetical protein